MLKNQLVKDIRSQLEKLQHLTDLISKSESPLSEVELELMQKSIMKLMEDLVRLKVSSEHVVKEEKVVQEPVTVRPDFPPPPVLEEIEIKKEKEPPLLVVEPTPMQNDNTVVHKPLVKEPAIVAEVRVPIAEKVERPNNRDERSLHENLKSQNDKETTLHEKLSAGAEKVLAHKLQETPIADLTKEITLNKKFGFVNDLFNGSMESYNAAINHLNQAGNLSSALEYIQQNLKEPLAWKDDSIAVIEFMDYIRRRWS